MESPSIIKRFDVIEDGQLDFGMVVPDLAVQELGLKRAEERFHGGVIVAVASGAHAAEQLVGFEQGAVIVAGVLNASIGVVQQTARGSSVLNRPAQRFLRQRALKMIGQGPADDLP